MSEHYTRVRHLLTTDKITERCGSVNKAKNRSRELQKQGHKVSVAK